MIFGANVEIFSIPARWWAGLANLGAVFIYSRGGAVVMGSTEFTAAVHFLALALVESGLWFPEVQTIWSILDRPWCPTTSLRCPHPTRSKHIHPMEILWNSYGKFVEILWKSYGNPMEIPAFSACFIPKKLAECKEIVGLQCRKGGAAACEVDFYKVLPVYVSWVIAPSSCLFLDIHIHSPMVTLIH